MASPSDGVGSLFGQRVYHSQRQLAKKTPTPSAPPVRLTHVRLQPFCHPLHPPGRADFLFPDGDSPASLVARLRDNSWQGQILGPHGSGKSTLLAALVPVLEAAGKTVERYAVQAGSPLAIKTENMTAWTDKTLVIIDGYEQLGWLARRKLRSLVRSRSAGLLVTAHKDAGLPTVFSTQPSEELARQIVARLLPVGDATITDADIARAYAAHGDNLRELLFALFDVYQSRPRN